ncbi:translocase of the inner membrane [Ranunculus cassubicifolius]
MADSPFPITLAEDTALSFAIGSLSNSLYHFTKSLSNSQTLLSAAKSVHKNRYGYRLGTRFAVCIALYDVSEKAICEIRGKDDIWNSVISGGVAGGVVGMGRGGLRVGAKWGLFGAGLCGCLEGVYMKAKSSQEYWEAGKY